MGVTPFRSAKTAPCLCHCVRLCLCFGDSARLLLPPPPMFGPTAPTHTCGSAKSYIGTGFTASETGLSLFFAKFTTKFTVP